MKTKLLLLLIISVILMSCSKETQVEKFAVKAALELGSGKYKEGVFGINLERFSLQKEGWISNCKSTEKQQKSIENFMATCDEDDFIDYNSIFSKCKVLSIKSHTIDLFNIVKKDGYDSESSEDLYENLRKIFFSNIPKEDIKIWKVGEEEIGFSYIYKRNIPEYMVNLLVDEKYIYTMLIIDNPDEGLQVALFGRTG